DAQLTNLQTAGMHPLLEVDFTPASLQPATTPCATGVPTYHAAPTDPAQWGQLAASAVAHVDQAFPGLAQDYEIWNEPDTQSGLCVAANTDAARQSAYISMFDAAASAMHQQASTDGVTIRIGGPALGNPVGELSSWIPALLGDATAAANIDLVSYHFFPSNQSAVNAGMNWNSSTATTPLYQRTQDASSGAAAVFNKASSLVKAGKQPNPSTTPILITDYNDGNGATVDCCRNDPTYGPLWNSLVLVDLLNTPYGGAQAIPNRLIYDAASLPSAAMCLLGNIDANFDCAYTAGTNPSPYPQYYSYLLFGSSQYLGLASGGNLATSISTSAGGLNVTAFYTGSADNLVLLNPTGSSVSNVPITLTNSGAVSSSATMFLLNSSTQTISSQPLTLSGSGSTLTTKLTVPAYSTIGISVPSLSSISVTVTPSIASIPSGQNQQFNAAVGGTSNQSVTWSVDGVNGGNGTVGTISMSGLYTAGSGTGTHTIRATSTASAGSSGTASVTVTTAQTVSVSVTPDPVSLPAGQAQQFTATVTGTSNPEVNWSVDGAAG